MEEKDKRSFRTRIEHKELLLQEAEGNPVIITMNFNQPNSRANYNNCWAALTARLNSLGYGEKSQEKWRRVLIDWISATKAKYLKLKKDREKTGGGPHCGIELTSLEERLMAIKGFTSVEGDGTTPEMGLLPPVTPQVSTSAVLPTTTDYSEAIILNVQDNEPAQKKHKRDHSNTTKIKTIQEMHEETLNELKNINSNMDIIAECMISINNTLVNNFTNSDIQD